jgi:hypothetical protein
MSEEYNRKQLTLANQLKAIDKQLHILWSDPIHHTVNRSIHQPELAVSCDLPAQETDKPFTDEDMDLTNH